jgi:hypothetical protein
MSTKQINAPALEAYEAAERLRHEFMLHELNQLIGRKRYSRKAVGSFLSRHCNSYDRLPAILDIIECCWLDGKQIFMLLRDQWTGFDNVGVHADKIREILLEYSADTHHMMDAKDKKAWAKLPDIIKVYRGCYPINRDGLCWSLCQQTAFKFTGMARYRGDGAPLMLAGTVRRKDAVLKLGRNEKEIVSALVTITGETTCEKWEPDKIYAPQ